MVDYNLHVDQDTVQRLLAINHEFYATFAESFAATRSVTDPALTAILPYLPERARIVDVGCGNGRLALLLERERPGTIYVGVDAAPELIEVARDKADELTSTEATYRVADVAQSNWTEGLPCRPFDCAVVLAVLHHIPDFDLRARVLGDIAGVLELDGFLILSSWQFLANERMRRKIVDWSEVGIDVDNLNPGDYLLDWKRGGLGFRYCHLIDAGEVKDLAAASGFRVRETFRAGGREGDLSLFAVLDRMSR